MLRFTKNCRRMSVYSEMLHTSIESPEAFWKEKAQAIHWDKPFTEVLDSSRSPLFKWFPDGKLNMSYNCLDRHVLAGRGEQSAIIHDSPMTKTITYYSFNELLTKVQQVAGIMIHRFHIKPKDRVILYMPLIPEAIIAMLACARIGATHSVVFGGFAAKELGNRIIDAKPKLIFTSNVGLEPNAKIEYLPIINAACEYAEHEGHQGATKIPRIVTNRGIVPCETKPGRDVDFYEVLHEFPKFEATVSVASSHPLYILYTSGTTGVPKGVVRDTGGYATALSNIMHWVFGMNPGDVFWAGSDIGWVVGHTLMVYGPLLRGCTSIVYEGKPIGTPDAGAWWRLISQHQAKGVFVAPTGIRAIKREDPDGEELRKYDLSSLEHIGIAGERCDPDTIHWLEKHLPSKTLINDHWWQTESGWPMISNYSGIEKFPVKAGSATKPVPGWNVQILDEENKPVAANTGGRVCVKLPTPPGFMLTLYGNDKSFVEKYMTEVPGYYLAGDEGFYDDEGYFSIMGRIDDIINTAGHRLSTGQMEEIICYHHDIAETAVIGVHDDIKGEVPMAFVVLKSGHDSHNITDQVIAMVREELGAVASLKKCARVPRLPKTRSGKILRNVLRKICNGKAYDVPATIEDASVLKDIEQTVRDIGLVKH